MTAGGIFVSYRRDDSGWVAGRIAERLADAFGEDRVFFDVLSIDVGLDFMEVIDQHLERCEVMVLVVGRAWAAIEDARGRRRLGAADDPHTYEVQAALDRGKRIVPVLVDGALMPEAAELPERLRPLVRRNAYPIAQTSFRVGVQDLVDRVRPLLGPRPERTDTGASQVGAPPERGSATAEPRGAVELRAGYASPYFADEATGLAERDHLYVLVADLELDLVADAVPILEQVLPTGRALAVIARSVHGELLSTLVVNHLRGTLPCLAVATPSFYGDERSLLEDVAAVTGASVVGPSTGTPLVESTLAHLGTATHVVATRVSTKLSGGGGSPTAVRARVTAVKEALEAASTSVERDGVLERLAGLTIDPA